MTVAWPDVELSPVRKLHVLAGAIPGAVLRERVMNVPSDAVWALVSDLEHGVPRFEPAVASARILKRDGDRLLLETRSPLRTRTVFDVVLRERFCWMQARGRVYVVGMAVEDAPGGGALFAHVEGVPRAGGRLLRPFIGLAVGHDLRSIERTVRRDLGM